MNTPNLSHITTILKKTYRIHICINTIMFLLLCYVHFINGILMPTWFGAYVTIFGSPIITLITAGFSLYGLNRASFVHQLLTTGLLLNTIPENTQTKCLHQHASQLRLVWWLTTLAPFVIALMGVMYRKVMFDDISQHNMALQAFMDVFSTIAYGFYVGLYYYMMGPFRKQGIQPSQYPSPKHDVYTGLSRTLKILFKVFIGFNLIYIVSSYCIFITNPNSLIFHCTVMSILSIIVFIICIFKSNMLFQQLSHAVYGDQIPPNQSTQQLNQLRILFSVLCWIFIIVNTVLLTPFIYQTTYHLEQSSASVAHFSKKTNDLSFNVEAFDD